MSKIILSNGKTVFWNGKTFLNLPLSEPTGHYLIDFGTDDNKTNGWNNITLTTQSINGLVDTSGRTSDINFKVYSDFNSPFDSFDSNISIPSGITNMYPSSAMSDMLFSYDSPIFYIIEGLDDTKVYDFTFFCYNDGAQDLENYYSILESDEFTTLATVTSYYTNEYKTTIPNMSITDFFSSSLILNIDGYYNEGGLSVLEIIEKTPVTYDSSSIDSIQVVFESVPTQADIGVFKTPFKYDKQYALSYSWDDGMVDAYTYGFKYLHGGVAGDSNYYSGKTFTDGCGNDVNFTVGLAIFSANGGSDDVHTPVYTANLQWDQMAEVYDAGWAINSHQYRDGESGTNYEVERNRSYVMLQTSGHTTTTDQGAIIKVFTQNSSNMMNSYIWDITGITSLYMYVNMNNSQWFGGGVNDHKAGIVDWDYVDGSNRIGYDTWPQIPFNFMRKDGTSSIKMKAGVAEITGATEDNTYHSWGGFLTHSVAGVGGGFGSFADFKIAMDWLEDEYGSGGLDNMWVSCGQAIFEYLYVAGVMDVEKTFNNNIMDINISSLDTHSGNTLPNNLREYALTLKITGATISDIIINGGTGCTYNTEFDTDTGLINLSWVGNTNKPTKEDYADLFVEIAETSTTQLDINVAQDYVSAMYNGSAKTALQVRIDAI